MILPKGKIFALCLEDGGTAVIHVRQIPGLRIPGDTSSPTRLEYTLQGPDRTPVHWTDKGIYADLSFHHIVTPTFVPWDAVVAISPKGQDVIVSWDWYVPSFVQEIVEHRPSAPPKEGAPRPPITIVRRDS